MNKKSNENVKIKGFFVWKGQEGGTVDDFADYGVKIRKIRKKMMNEI